MGKEGGEEEVGLRRVLLCLRDRARWNLNHRVDECLAVNDTLLRRTLAIRNRYLR